jgi:L-asparagine transporter-like permease
MDYFGLICYFGGDAAGSFGMFYIPSILLYAIAGSILCLIMRVIERIRKKNSADK